MVTLGNRCCHLFLYLSYGSDMGRSVMPPSGVCWRELGSQLSCATAGLGADIEFDRPGVVHPA